jgi:hypothetical protein
MFPITQTKTEFALTHKLIYAWPKVGKTTLAAQQKVGSKIPLFIMTEDGEGTLNLAKARVKDWKHFTKLVELLEKQAEKVKETYSCLVIDLISDLDQWCQESIAKDNNVKHVSDLSYGKGFNLAKEEFRSQLSKLMALLPVTFIAHSGEKDVIVNGETIKVQKPQLSTGAYDFVNGKVDTIMYISPANSKKDQSEVVIQGSKMAICGSRFPQINDVFLFPKDRPEQVYVNINNRFKGSEQQ